MDCPRDDLELQLHGPVNRGEINSLTLIFQLSNNRCYILVEYCIYAALKEGPEGGTYSHFPAHILTKSHCPTAQIPSSLCRSCSNLNPIPIFYCFFVDASQSQCMKSHFPSQKMDKSQFPFYPFRTPLKGFLTY